MKRIMSIEMKMIEDKEKFLGSASSNSRIFIFLPSSRFFRFATTRERRDFFRVIGIHISMKLNSVSFAYENLYAHMPPSEKRYQRDPTQSRAYNRVPRVS